MPQYDYDESLGGIVELVPTPVSETDLEGLGDTLADEMAEADGEVTRLEAEVQTARDASAEADAAAEDAGNTLEEAENQLEAAKLRQTKSRLGFDSWQKATARLNGDDGDESGEAGDAANEDPDPNEPRNVPIRKAKSNDDDDEGEDDEE